jgi:glyceraldehyde 3-phosphate dehydrogenase
MKILLNGIGRIGKAILRIALEKKYFQIVAINEINQNIENIAYFINYDSTYGKFKDKFKVNGKFIENSDCKIDILNYDSLEDINFNSLGIDIVIDSSGAKINIENLKKLSPKLFFLTHPNKNADLNIILGANEQKLNLNIQKVISTSSCNATALLPILKLVDDNYKIKYGDIATIHPLLNHQKTLDGQCVGSTDRNIDCSFEFGRSSTQNIIPSKTTTVDACSFVIKDLNKEVLSSNSFRVPTAVVGAINVTLFVEEDLEKDKFIKLCKEYEKNQEYKIIFNNFDPLVSSDFQSCEHTTIIDHRYTQIIQKNMIKLVLWYDNEWGYASKVVEIINKSLKGIK